MTIAFRDDGDGPAVVWVHGFPLSSDVFARQTAIAGFRHIRPDLCGFGASPAPTHDLTMRNYAHEVLDVLDELHIERAIVAGLSMGGYVVMQMLRDAPHRVATLMLVSTRETADSEEGRLGRTKSAEDVAAHGTQSVVDSMLPKMVVNDAFRDEARRIMESASPRGVVSALRAMAARPDSTDTLRRVHVPTLITVGDKDTITTVADAQRMQSLIPRAEVVVIRNAAHLAIVEQADEANRAFARFLRM